jgi:hypothetical protein
MNLRELYRLRERVMLEGFRGMMVINLQTMIAHKQREKYEKETKPVLDKETSFPHFSDELQKDREEQPFAHEVLVYSIIQYVERFAEIKLSLKDAYILASGLLFFRFREGLGAGALNLFDISDSLKFFQKSDTIPKFSDTIDLTLIERRISLEATIGLVDRLLTISDDTKTDVVPTTNSFPLLYLVETHLGYRGYYFDDQKSRLELASNDIWSVLNKIKTYHQGTYIDLDLECSTTLQALIHSYFLSFDIFCSTNYPSVCFKDGLLSRLNSENKGDMGIADFFFSCNADANSRDSPHVGPVFSPNSDEILIEDLPDLCADLNFYENAHSLQNEEELSARKRKSVDPIGPRKKKKKDRSQFITSDEAVSIVLDKPKTVKKKRSPKFILRTPEKVSISQTQTSPNLIQTSPDLTHHNLDPYSRCVLSGNPGPIDLDSIPKLIECKISGEKLMEGQIVFPEFQDQTIYFRNLDALLHRFVSAGRRVYVCYKRDQLAMCSIGVTPTAAINGFVEKLRRYMMPPIRLVACDPISQVFEYTSKKGVECEFFYSKDGIDHSPIWTCHGVLGEFTSSQSNRVKQEAKRECARDLIRQLRNVFEVV